MVSAMSNSKNHFDRDRWTFPAVIAWITWRSAAMVNDLADTPTALWGEDSDNEVPDPPFWTSVGGAVNELFDVLADAHEGLTATAYSASAGDYVTVPADHWRTMKRVALGKAMADCFEFERAIQPSITYSDAHFDAAAIRKIWIVPKPANAPSTANLPPLGIGSVPKIAIHEGEWVRLTEAGRRYDAAIGYAESKQNFERMPDDILRLMQQVSQEMSQAMTEAAASGRIKFKGATDKPQALTDIPTEYFRLARTFATRHNEILAYADSQTTGEWAESRSYTVRHPTWIDVVTHRASFDEWLKTVRSAILRPASHDLSRLPDKKSLTLAEVTSFLAFGHTLEGSQIAEWCDPSFKERKDLIERCLLEAEGKSELSHWPSNLGPDAKELALALFEENTPKPWPPSGERLYQLAIAQSYSQDSNDLRIAVAGALIHNWAFNGKLKITGVKEASTAHEEIDHRSFATRYEKDWWYGNRVTPPLLENDGRFTWSKVFVERNSLASMLEKYSVPDADSKSEIVLFANEARWGLVPSLVWIATRDITLASKAANPGESFSGAEIGLSIRKSMHHTEGGITDWSYGNLKNAWTNDLALRMSEGKLSAFATRVSCRWDGGLSQSAPGVIFPPADAPGAALEHRIDDSSVGPFLRPNGSQGANSWNEWHNVTFARADVLKVWPERKTEEPMVMDVTNVATESRITRPSSAELRVWFEKRRNTWPLSKACPTEIMDVQAAKLDFQGIGRQQIREARRSGEDRWTKKGKRKPQNTM